MMNVEVHDGDARLPRGQRLRRGDRSVAEHAEAAAARTYIVALAHRVVPRRPHEHKGARAGRRGAHRRQRRAGRARRRGPRARADRRRASGRVDAALAKDARPQHRRQAAARSMLETASR